MALKKTSKECNFLKFSFLRLHTCSIYIKNEELNRQWKQVKNFYLYNKNTCFPEF